MHGSQAVRATLAQERWSQPQMTRTIPDSRQNQARRSLLEPTPEQLELEIYTPLTFSDSLPLSSDKDVPSAVLDRDGDVDMSFDLDSDSESDSDSDTGDDDDALSMNESILDVSLTEPLRDIPPTPPPEADSSSAFSSLTTCSTPSFPPPIMIPSLPPIWPPRFPRLSSIPVYCLREYPQMELLGTPSRNAPCARGTFRLKSICVSTTSERMSVVL